MSPIDVVEPAGVGHGIVPFLRRQLARQKVRNLVLRVGHACYVVTLGDTLDGGDSAVGDCLIVVAHP